MRKVVGLLIIVLSLGVIAPAQAQINWGVKGGLNLGTSLSGAWKDAGNTDNYTGFFIGPTMEFKVPLIGVGVDGSLLYSQKGNKLAGKSLKQQGLEVPLNLKYSFGLSSLASIYLAAGPSFFYNFNSDDKFGDAVVDYESWETSLNLGFGVRLLKKIQVGANYNMPLSDSGKVHASNLWNGKSKSYKTKIWQVSMTYWF